MYILGWVMRCPELYFAGLKIATVSRGDDLLVPSNDFVCPEYVIALDIGGTIVHSCIIAKITKAN